jgi:hypothetical protein
LRSALLSVAAAWSCLACAQDVTLGSHDPAAQEESPEDTFDDTGGIDDSDIVDEGLPPEGDPRDPRPGWPFDEPHTHDDDQANADFSEVDPNAAGHQPVGMDEPDAAIPAADSDDQLPDQTGDKRGDFRRVEAGAYQNVETTDVDAPVSSGFMGAPDDAPPADQSDESFPSGAGSYRADDPETGQGVADAGGVDAGRD